MLRADQAPYFDTCPRCAVGGLERLKTHTYCVNCNYEEVGSSEIGALPRWAIEALKTRKPKSIVQEPRSKNDQCPLVRAVLKKLT